MRESARLQAAIELADLVLESARDNGPAADTIVQRYFRERRYAGSKDRRRIRDLLFAAIRFTADPPVSGRALFAGFAQHGDRTLLPLFDGGPHGPAPLTDDEPHAAPSLVPAWLKPRFEARFGARLEAEASALIGRAPLDLRVHRLRSDPAAVAAALPVPSAPVPGLPDALRLAEPVPLEQLPAFRDGWFEVQDAGSQRVALLANARPGQTVIDLCAGAGGKTLALADHMEARGRLVASDTARVRLQAMDERLARTGLTPFVERRLLDPGAERERLGDLAGRADVVLVDAPCSGTGTWRRNPELRWRLTGARLRTLVAMQARLIDLGAWLLRPGGTLVYAVCSVLREEGAEQIEAAATRLGLRIGAIEEWTPAADGCDGFTAGRLVAPL